MASSFLKQNRPTLIGMLKSKTTEELLNEINLILAQGVDAFGFQIEQLTPKERKAENYKKIFFAMKGKPSYVTNYIRGNVLNLSDEELTEELLLAVECGAKLVDIRCDLFDRQPDEYSTDEVAIAKQKDVIRRLKDMGAEVLISTHTLRYTPCERVLEIALSQQARGADVVKIVTGTSTEEQLRENMKTTMVLKEQLDVPFLFLSVGAYCRVHRMIGPLLGTDLFLAAANPGPSETQPSIREAREQLTLAGYTNLP